MRSGKRCGVRRRSGRIIRGLPLYDIAFGPEAVTFFKQVLAVIRLK